MLSPWSPETGQSDRVKTQKLGNWIGSRTGTEVRGIRGDERAMRHGFKKLTPQVLGRFSPSPRDVSSWEDRTYDCPKTCEMEIELLKLTFYGCSKSVRSPLARVEQPEVANRISDLNSSLFG